MPLPCNEPHGGKSCIPIYSEGSEFACLLVRGIQEWAVPEKCSYY